VSEGADVDPSPVTETAAPAQEREDTPVQAARITTPRPVDTHVDPIAGHWNAAEVVLSLVIDAEGNIESAKLVSGSEPFSGAALRAAPNWKFEPAKRGDDAVPSKIHFLVVFEPRKQPEDELEGAEPDSPDSQPEPSQAPAVEASGQALEEVVVYGDIPDPGSTELTRAEVRNLAGAFGDPLRAIESMPGVIPIVSGLPLFFVRGAPPGNVGFYIDGIPHSRGQRRSRAC
jgi:TonB family protein